MGLYKQTKQEKTQVILKENRKKSTRNMKKTAGGTSN